MAKKRVNFLRWSSKRFDSEVESKEDDLCKFPPMEFETYGFQTLSISKLAFQVSATAFYCALICVLSDKI
ncbi:MAG: hypothetical protein HXK63_00905 [Campylobacter sp.]|nr:hypothetical protein [Campylobacter sp.]